MLSAMTKSLRPKTCHMGIWTCQKGSLLICARTIYGSSRLGIDAYVQNRARLALQMANSREDFYQRINNFADGQEHLVTSEDLNQMLHVATGEEQDQTLLQRMVTRYHGESSGLRFNKFVFGPVVMRMYWHLKLADKALEAFNNPTLAGFFDQISSFVVLQDLLYKQGRYEDVLTTMEAVMKRQVQGAKHPVDCVVVTMAACYQLNTAASYEFCRSLLERLDKVGHTLSRRAASFAVALMLRRGEPHEALRLLQRRTDIEGAMLRDLKAIALSELGRPAPAVETLRQPLLLDLPEHVRNSITVTQEAVDSVEAAVQKKNDAEVTSNWKIVKQGLKSYGFLKGKSLEDVITIEIAFKRQQRPYPQANALRATFNRGQRPVSVPARPGLTDMVD